MASKLAKPGVPRRFAAVAAVMMLAVAGCVGSRASASRPASPGAGHPETASASAHPSATPTATPAASYDLTNVRTAPAGDWKSIHWMQVPATPAAAPSATPDPSSGLVDGYGTVDVAGWSHGFVGFSVQIVEKAGQIGGPTMATIATTHSSDGVHWNDGTVITQQISVDDLDVIGLYEGPSGLLAVGESGACAVGWVEALWTSPDGISWQKVDTKKAFGQTQIDNVSGGSSGFVATAANGSAVWTSRDGQTWRPVDLSAAPFAASRINYGTAFSGGYVLAGSTEDTGIRSCSTSVFDPSATPTPAPPMRSPAVWWSADGGTWNKSQLPGATSAAFVSMRICRINDRTLVAFENYSDGTNDGSAVWTSNDGRTWSSSDQPLNPYRLLSDGEHGLLVNDPTQMNVAHAPSGNASISLVTEAGAVVALDQDSRPPYDYKEQWAVGPTGILWTDGSELWIGIPS